MPRAGVPRSEFRSALVAIEVNNATFYYPDGTLVIDELSFRVPTASVTALVGPNGVGKTTMLGLIAGDLPLDEGTIRSDTEIAYMRQNPGFDDPATATVIDALALSLPRELRPVHRKLREMYGLNDGTAATGIAIAEALDAWQALGGYEEEATWDQVTRAVLDQGLEVAGERRLRELSGGERKGIILRSFLASSVPTLILDEPDNFLDMNAKSWLEQSLKDSPKTILLVSHDRTLLTKAVDRMIVLEHNGNWVHGGNYGTFREERRLRNERLAKDADAWKNEERRLYRLYKLMKNRAGISEALASRADAAQTRWERFRDAGPPQLPPPEREIVPKFVGSRAGNEAIRITRLEVADLVLPFNLTVYNGDRVALLGENGVGKSTFLRSIRSRDLAEEGVLRFGPNAKLGFFSQDVDIPFAERELLDIVKTRFPNPEQARAALGRYGLADRTRHRVSELSGGQKARVQLLLLERDDPNVLLLDEPTDNLDLESIQVIEEVLVDLDATQVAITHDGWFTRVFNRFIIFDKDGLVGEVPERLRALHIAGGRGFSLVDEPDVKILTEV
jgi:ATPase subunit of ABC transporter with duplicated ATPase domains